MTSQNHYWDRFLKTKRVIFSLILPVLATACIDFPSLPALNQISDQAVSNPDYMIDQQVPDQKLGSIQDMLTVDMIMVDQVIVNDMREDQELMVDQDAMIEVDMEVSTNFTMYRCNGDVLESMDGGELTTIPCSEIMIDSQWIKVEPIPEGVGIGIDNDDGSLDLTMVMVMMTMPKS